MKVCFLNHMTMSCNQRKKKYDNVFLTHSFLLVKIYMGYVQNYVGLYLFGGTYVNFNQ